MPDKRGFLGLAGIRGEKAWKRILNQQNFAIDTVLANG